MGHRAARRVRRISRADRRLLDGASGRRRSSTRCAAKCERVSQKIGKRAKFLVGKPGLDGHSNGAEQIAVRARDAGFDVIYAGIRSTPAELVETAKKEGAHCVGLSILSGSHVTLAHEVMRLMKEEGVAAPLVVGGIIPPADEKLLRDAGVAAVYTPKNYDLNVIMTDLAQIIEKSVVKLGFGRSSGARIACLSASASTEHGW